MSDARSATIDIPERGNRVTTNGRADDERWLFVDGADTFGGHEAMVLRWLEELQAQRSVRTVLLARAGGPLAEQARQHTQVVALPARRGGLVGRAFGALTDALAFVRTVARIKPRLCIVAEGCLLDQPLFAFLARIMGVRVLAYVPLLQTSVSMGFRSGRLRDAFVRHVYRRILDGWVAITPEQAEDFRAWADIRTPIFTLPNTVARSIEGAAAASARPHGSGRALRVLVLGRLEAHQKGLDMLLDFLVSNPTLGARFRVTFVGSGPYEPVIARRLSEDAALARWVSLQPWSATLEALSAHDVLLLTSRYEGVPLVMLEAMALGVPVVASDLPGTRAFLEPHWLFPREDMAAAFERLSKLAEPGVRRHVIERNRSEFQRRASNQAFATAVAVLTPQLCALAAVRRRSA